MQERSEPRGQTRGGGAEGSESAGRRRGREEEGWGEKERGRRLFILAGDNNDLILSPFYWGLGLQVTDRKC